LADRGIPVEIKRLSTFSLYFGAPAPDELEFRVPLEHLKEALEVLEALRQEMELNVLAEAGVAPGDESDELPPPERRPRKLAWAVAISLIAPIPGCGLLYARAFRLGYLMFGLCAAFFVAGMATGNE